MAIHATRFIRKMRGGAQAHLLECDDGHFYVVKFSNNPQHRRILINEWIASAFLNYLQIFTPPAAIVILSASFLEANPGVHIQMGSRHQAVEPGWHFGSRYPGDPGKIMVYDFLPDALLDKVVNANEFLGVLAFDKWMGNADARQSIFFRARLRLWPQDVCENAPRSGFVAQMMDHGYVFEGPHWKFPDSPLQGLYFRPSVYRRVQGWHCFEPWLDSIVHFPQAVAESALKEMPENWLVEDCTELHALLEKLMTRRMRVPDLIRNSRNGLTTLFPEWR
jgi:hypothetical protein